MPNIPPKADRRWNNCFSPALYRGRKAIERMFCRLSQGLPLRRPRYVEAHAGEGVVRAPVKKLRPSFPNSHAPR